MNRSKTNFTFKDECERARRYWKSKLSGEIIEINFPCDFERIPDYKKDTCKIEFTEELSSRLLSLSKNQDILLYVVLLSVLKVFIFKYLDTCDITIGAPVYTHGSKYDAGEKLLVFNDMLDNKMTFKDVLTHVKQTVIEGYENQFFIIENMLDVLRLTIPDIVFSRVIFLLENIHDKRKINDIIHSTSNDMTISILRNQEGLEGNIQYNSNLFRRNTIKSICTHYLYVLEQVLSDINIKLADINLLSEEEKKRVIYDFNDTQAAYPQTRTIHTLFEDRVETAPDNTAVVYEEKQLSYRKINEKANRLAGLLRVKGRATNTIAGLMMEDTLETVTSIMGVLKAGWAYLPIDPTYPEERKRYILNDSQIQVLLLQVNLADDNNHLLKQFSIERILIDGTDGDTLSPGETIHFSATGQPDDLAYVVYTSGTTGRPKGALVEHQGIVNYTCWRLNTYDYRETDVTLQMLPYFFDGFGSNFYSSLLSGGTLLMIPDPKKLDGDFINESIKQWGVTNTSLIPAMYQMILDHAEQGDLKSLRFVVLAGEKSRANLIEMSKEKAPEAILVNEYGPTETTVTAAAYWGMNELNRSIIGKPISNTHIYILDNSLKPTSIKVTGELCVAGEGVARGYLNNPELTAEKFNQDFQDYQDKKEKVDGFHHSSLITHHSALYRTGDLARWLPDGNLELVGRMNRQVKVRGYRIELGEIENRLIEIDTIKEAVVLDIKDRQEETYLCAYFVLEGGVDAVTPTPLSAVELKNVLSKTLPPYMIPSYFIQLERIPLIPNGKIDRKALPAPEVKSGKEYIAPRNAVEEKLAEIWSNVLKLDKEIIGIDDNFFDLGGHSLRATVLISRIHKELNVKLSLAEMFKFSTIRGLSDYIKGAVKNKFISLEAVEKKEYYPLSSSQKRLYLLQRKVPTSTAYHMAEIMAVEGEADKDKLEATFRKLIQRHESLRTSVQIVGGLPVQRIHLPHDVDFTIDYYEAGQEAEIIKQNFVRPFDLSRAPLLRVALVYTPPSRPFSPEASSREKYILMVDMHHIVSDGVSHTILINDFTALYAGEQRPPLRLHYKDFSQWQNTISAAGEMKKQEAFWLKTFAGEIPSLSIPTDYPRPAVQRFEADSVSFVINSKKSAWLKAFARKEEATIFMVLLALYNVLLSKLSGQEDIVVGTGAAARPHADLEKVIGMFVNTLALRNYPAGEKTFKTFAKEVRERTLQAFDNQDYLFEDLVDNIVTKQALNRNPLFDTLFLVQNLETEAGERPEPVNRSKNNMPRDTDLPGMRSENQKNQKKTSKFDIIFFCIDAGEKLLFTIEYCSTLFKKETIKMYIRCFKEILSLVTENQEVKLKDIVLSSDLGTIKPGIIQNDPGDFGF